MLYNYGPNIVGENGPQSFEFREHSFMQNPRCGEKCGMCETHHPDLDRSDLHFRFPESYHKENQLVITPGAKPCEGGAKCEASAVSVDPVKGFKLVTVPKNLKQKQLLKVLEPHK